ncbi:MAG: hypothetical protein ACEQSB_00715 [Undibacterium sp.]
MNTLDTKYGFDARSHVSIGRFAYMIGDLHGDELAVVLATIHVNGLMLMKNWSIRLSFWFARKLRGELGVVAMFSSLQAKAPKIIQEIVDQTVSHIRYGKDLIDEESVGGFCQTEMDLILDALYQFRQMQAHPDLRSTQAAISVLEKRRVR